MLIFLIIIEVILFFCATTSFQTSKTSARSLHYS